LGFYRVRGNPARIFGIFIGFYQVAGYTNVIPAAGKSGKKGRVLSGRAVRHAATQLRKWASGRPCRYKATISVRRSNTRPRVTHMQFERNFMRGLHYA
jgi:hypothetical protein